jgi:HEPN domain-containing protein
MPGVSNQGAWIMNAAWEKLLDATLALTTAEPIKQRLIRSFSDHLEKLDPAALPREARASLRELTQRLAAARPMPGETAVAATVRKMSNQEAEDCARSIVELLAQCHALSQPATPDVTATVVVPLHAPTPPATLTDNVPPLLALNRA